MRYIHAFLTQSIEVVKISSARLQKIVLKKSQSPKIANTNKKGIHPGNFFFHLYGVVLNYNYKDLSIMMGFFICISICIIAGVSSFFNTISYI